MNKKIVPAIIAKNQNELNERLSKVIKYVDLVQLDVMDNRFVPNTSLFFDFSLSKTKCQFETHLMVQNPEDWIERNGNKVDTVLVHYESCNNPKKIIEQVKTAGKKIGFVLNPKTPISKLTGFLNDIDQVLIMTVNPGFYGSPFLPEMLEKISNLRKLKPKLDIEVDGGITDKTIGLVDKVGANMFVSGSYIVKSDNVEEAINSLKEIIGD
ncbi:MAG: ribulose-phosphate 3-epimerase [Thermoplasmatales archaeon]|nr:MAG: ribulose-phosphate 3-epimerase [Thermoplasmatales archaeon]